MLQWLAKFDKYRLSHPFFTKSQVQSALYNTRLIIMIFKTSSLAVLAAKSRLAYQ